MLDFLFVAARETERVDALLACARTHHAVLTKEGETRYKSKMNLCNFPKLPQSYGIQSYHTGHCCCRDLLVNCSFWLDRADRVVLGRRHRESYNVALGWLHNSREKGQSQMIKVC